MIKNIMIGLNFNGIIVKIEEKILRKIKLFDVMLNSKIPKELDNDGNIIMKMKGGEIYQVIEHINEGSLISCSLKNICNYLMIDDNMISNFKEYNYGQCYILGSDFWNEHKFDPFYTTKFFFDKHISGDTNNGSVYAYQRCIVADCTDESFPYLNFGVWSHCDDLYVKVKNISNNDIIFGNYELAGMIIEMPDGFLIKYSLIKYVNDKFIDSIENELNQVTRYWIIYNNAVDYVNNYIKKYGVHINIIGK